MVGSDSSRRPARRQLAALAVVIVAASAIVTTAVLQGSPSVAQPSGSPGSSSAGSPGPSGAAAWTALDLEPLQAAATLEPSTQDEAGVRSDAMFTLTSLTTERATDLAGRLEFTPATPFTISEGANGTSATISPASPLAAGKTYRAALRTADGALAASWAFRVRGPVNVLSTIPGDGTVSVPVNTGIEVAFDQEAVADMNDHFSIVPAVEGRFERHGRTQVFVPNALARATTYTVTVRSGLARTGTDLALPADVVFRFETEGDFVREARVVVGRDVIETAPGDVPVIAARAIVPETDEGPGPAPKSADVRVYRLPSLDRAVDALTGFLAAPRWTEFSDPLMPTDGLPAVATFTAPLEPIAGEQLLLRFPEALDEGWYIVEIQGPRPSQAFLQVTPVSAWVSVLSDKTVAWVNDVVTHRALSGATVAVGTAAPFARSDADGLASGPTPAALVPPAAAGDDAPPPSPILRVTSAGGDVVLVPFDVRGLGEAYRGEWSEKTEPADETYWAMLYTDRGLYRRSDTIEVWGYLRGRDDGQVPGSVQLRLVANAASNDADAPAAIAVTATPGSDGAFAASLPVVNLPLDSYRVQAIVNDRVVVSRWVTVSIIRKPPYQLAMTSNHLAVIAGSKVTWTTAATFFDGTPVASVGLVLSGGEISDERRATTNAEGKASLSLTARTDPGEDGDAWEDPDSWDVDVRPAGPESADIWTSHSILTFPSALDLHATGVVKDGKLRVTGTLSTVDLAKVEAQLAAGTWDGDASGDAVRGQTIRVKITELIPVRRQVGTTYDFIEKVVRPLYEYDIERKAFRTLSVESAAGGKVALSVAVPDPDHEYEVVLSTRDKADRLAQRTLNAGRPTVRWWEQDGIIFETVDGLAVDETRFAIGDEIVWRMVDAGEPLPSGDADRYLYLVSQRGLRSAFVSDAATFQRTFSEADAPGIFVIGVRFSGTTYAPKASTWAMFDPAEREIRVRVTADRERYRPGETATLAVETTRPNGSPVAATVILQAVDEKLYAMGGATVPDPLADLYQRVDSGIVRLTATHQVPNRSGAEGEGGDTTGGGERSDFKDTLLFREIRTDASGKGSVTVQLSDDLTSWHVTASAVTRGLAAGVGEVLVPVGLPFFVELTVADSYLASDRPALQVRAFGDALRAGDPVSFSVTSSSLGLAETRVEGTAYEPLAIALPELSNGVQSVTVSATVPGRKDEAGRPLSDALTRTFDVVGSRLTAGATAYGVVADGLPSVPAGAERSTWTFADAGRGKLVPVLASLAMPAGLRLDRALAQSIARDLLVAEFGRDPASLPSADFDSSSYPIGRSEREDGTIVVGAGLLPYAGLDPWLATRVAILAPDALDRQTLRDTLVEMRDLPTTKRDLAIAAMAGLAAIGEPMLGELQEARRQADLTPAELIDLALGFAAAGDDASARTIERDLLGRYGEQFGRWVRLRLDPTPGGADPTALVAVIAASVGDPLADGLADYAIANVPVDTVNALELVAYASVSLERTPAAAAAFAYRVDGERTVVRLRPGESFNLVLTPAQAAAIAVENLSGRVGVAIDARVPVEIAALRPHPDLTLTRALPDQPIPTVGLVTVDLTATFAETAPEGCYDIVELVPSGLAPLAIGSAGSEDEGSVTWPASVVGQEVRFCAENNAETGHRDHLRYVARVVNEGTFAWEPAIMQFPGGPELLAITPAGAARIEAQ